MPLNKTLLVILLSMVFILNPLFFILFIGLLSPYLTSIEKKLAAFICVTFAIVFYSTLQPFGDLAEYLHVYNQINNIDLFNYKRFGMGVEIFILLLMKIVYFVSNGNEFAFLFSVYSVIFALLIKICKKIDNDFYILLFLTVFFSYGFVQSNSYFLRQIISILFVFLMFLSVKKISVITYCFLAVTSHVSGLLSICVYVAYSLKNNKKMVLLILLLSIVSIIISYKLGFLDYVIYKLESATQKFSLLSLVQIISYSIPFVVIFYFLYKYRIYISKDKSSSLIIIFSIVNFILFWGFIKVPAMSNRFALFMCAFPSILLAPILKGYVTHLFRFKILLVILFLNIIPMFYTLYFVELKGSELNFLNYQPISSGILDIINILLDRISGALPYLSQGN
ncbi:EpsG family protein [Photobacterium damselae]|uniref:EpsG family protein n=1 Tax=Photobacterium damselae TaxID=38293 RepID=UPI004068003B